MIVALKSYKKNTELLRMLTDPIQKTEYTISSKLDEDLIYQTSLRSAETYLQLIWKMIHGMSLAPMTNASELEIMHAYYSQSELWFRTEHAEVDSDLFIGRFLSEIALHLSDNLDKIVVDYVINSTKDIKVRDKIDMLDQIILCYTQLAKNMICNKRYSIESDKLFELMTMCTCGGIKRRTSLIKIYNDQISILRDTVKNGLFGSDFMVEDSILINNILLLTYMIVTEDPKARKMFSIKADSTFDDVVEMKATIRKLGRQILDHRDMMVESDSLQAKANPQSYLYEIFLRCKPKILYKYSEVQKDECLREGCRALAYIGFMSQSKAVKKILDRMIYA